MRYSKRRRLYSQNFLRDPKLVSELIRRSSIGKFDTVLEIGPGKGNITEKLTPVAGKVIAVEIDSRLVLYLRNKFRFKSNLEIIEADFLKFNLPGYPYKVFANTPFRITSDIVRKLTDDRNFYEGFLVVQKEAAQKFAGKPYDQKNSMMASLMKPWFDINIIYKFSRRDFVPYPNVDCSMIRINKRRIPLVPDFHKEIYRDYILYSYNRQEIYNEDFDEILKIFNKYIENENAGKKIYVHKEALKIIKSRENIRKIRRTRNDRNWRKF